MRRLFLFHSFLIFVCFCFQYVVNANYVPKRRIIGGYNSTIEEHPYLVAFEINNHQMCAGSLITRRSVLTAGHCAQRNRAVYRFRLGSTFKERGGILMTVEKFIVHPKYKHGASLNFDIAIAILQRPVMFSPKIQPIRMAERYDKLTDGDIVHVSGWGYTVTNSRASKPDSLNAVDLLFIDFDICKTIMRDELFKGMMCAGSRRFDRDACTSDSGGPLVHDSKLYGIVSWGKDCADMYHPGVYTDVAYYRDFIDHNII